MITLTREEVKTVLRMVFENPNESEQSVSAHSTMIKKMPDEVEKLLRRIAGQDKNILLTLIAVVFYVMSATKASLTNLASLESILDTAASVSEARPDVLKELCEREVSVRVPHLLVCLEEVNNGVQNTLYSIFISKEPAGNC